MRIPRKAALLGAAVFVLALPASNAFAGATPTDKKQNTRIAKLSKDLTTLKKTALTLSGTLATKASLDGVDNRLKAIEARRAADRQWSQRAEDRPRDRPAQA